MDLTAEAEIRPSRPEDASGMSAVVNVLNRAGIRRTGGDVSYIMRQYLAHPDQLACFVAVEHTGRLLGFQSLKVATRGNPYGAPLGWGVIGTHILPDAGRKGLGRRFFAETLQVARDADLPAIEAGIGSDNATALAFYAAMGFESYRADSGIDFKRYLIAAKA